MPTNVGVPKYPLDSRLTSPAPLDPARLYLSAYPLGVTYAEANPDGPMGLILRPGSTSMWGGIHLINGYSPIRPDGVASLFESEIHGDIPEEVIERFLREEAGPSGELARLGVDGILVAREWKYEPQPASEWSLVLSNHEGRVYHRQGEPLAAVRSRPNEQFAAATVSRIINGRNRLSADVSVSAGERPALLAISRPFFPGYRARLNDRQLPVTSDRGLYPTIVIPAGMSGRLTLVYRPGWLLGGGVIAGLSAIVILASLAWAWRAWR